MIVPIRSTFVESPADWFGPALAATNDWIYQLTPADAAEIDAAFRSARSHGRTLETLERADFPLPSFSARLSHALDFIENQRGIYVLRGLPTALYSKDDLRLIYWASENISEPPSRRVKTVISSVTCAISAPT